MLKKALTTLAISAALAAAAPGFANPPQAKAPGAEQAVDTAQAPADEKGKAKSEQHSRSAHQAKHRAASKQQSKPQGEEQHKPQ